MENNTQSDIAGKHGKQYTVKSCGRTSKIKQSDLAANIKNITQSDLTAKHCATLHSQI
jgi:hypothetical protein